MAFKMKGPSLLKMVKNSAVKNLGFIKAKTLEKNPNAKTMNVDGKEMPIKMKKAPAKMAKDPAMKMKKAPTKMKKEEPMKMKKAAMKMKKAPMRAEMPTDVKNLTKTNYKEDTKKKSGPDFSKAPKLNTQARRDWYTKNNLAQDATTKLKPTTPKKIETKKVTKVDKPTKTTKTVGAQGAKVGGEKVMEGKKTLGDTKLGNVKVGKNGKRLADTKIGKAFSKGRAKGVAERKARAERMAKAKAERIAKRKARKEANKNKK